MRLRATAEAGQLVAIHQNVVGHFRQPGHGALHRQMRRMMDIQPVHLRNRSGTKADFHARHTGKPGRDSLAHGGFQFFGIINQAGQIIWHTGREHHCRRHHGASERATAHFVHPGDTPPCCCSRLKSGIASRSVQLIARFERLG
jgi:hypothetical protein